MQYDKAETNANSRLFDASAIMLLSKRCPERASTILDNQLRLDLTLYELGNTIWKIHRLINKADKTVVFTAIEKLYDVTALMDVRGINDLDEITAIMNLACEWHLTFYASSYLYVASEMGITLVSEDQAIVKVAKKINVKCISAVECAKLV